MAMARVFCASAAWISSRLKSERKSSMRGSWVSSGVAAIMISLFPCSSRRLLSGAAAGAGACDIAQQQGYHERHQGHTGT